MSHPFTHIELNTTDVAKAKDFYRQMFSWQMDDLPDMQYTMVKTGEAPDGGIMKHPMPGEPSFWLTYVLVDDIQASTKKAVSLGAKIIRDVHEVSGRGWLSIFFDPTGAPIGLWQPK